MRPPKEGTELRAAYDAAHARWCGPDCRPTCDEWRPDLDELRAVIRAVDAFRDARYRTVLARELAPIAHTDQTLTERHRTHAPTLPHPHGS